MRLTICFYLKLNVYFYKTFQHFSQIVDITVFHNGYHGDLNETFFVGKVDEKNQELVQTTYEALKEAINMGKMIILCYLCHNCSGLDK